MPDQSSVNDLLTQLGWANKTVAVEHNGDALIRSEHARVMLHDGDTLEIVKAAAGG
jgi:sulfur carrier protein